MNKIIGVDKEKFLREVLQIKNERLIQALAPLCNIRSIAKRKQLIKSGDTQDCIFFLVKGIFRGVYGGEDGAKDVTDCIVYQSGQPLMASSELGETAPITVEALTDSTVIALSLSSFQALQRDYPELTDLHQKFTLESARMHWELKIKRYTLDAEQRYRWFLENYPGVIDKVTHTHVAAFLNMTHITLSRLYNKDKDKHETSPD